MDKLVENFGKTSGKQTGEYMVLGCGAMGCALGHVLSLAGNEVEMIVLDYDEHVFQNCVVEGKVHQGLGITLHEGLKWKHLGALGKDDMSGREIIVAVNSEGLAWSQSWLSDWSGVLRSVIFATKGLLISRGENLASQNLGLLEGLKDSNGNQLAVGIFAGPCLAGELARQLPTSLVVASADNRLLERTRAVFSGVDCVNIETNNDVLGTAWSAALKNLYAIGVSATEGMWEGGARNAQASVFARSLQEMAKILLAMGFEEETVWGLAGVGDLHVTVGGGRNGKFGKLLGQGFTTVAIENDIMKGVTVEGLYLARALHPFLENLALQGAIDWEELPLTKSLLDSLIGGTVLSSRNWFRM